MIGEYQENMAPRVIRHRGMVGILGTDDGKDFGFLISPKAAVEIATRLLAAVADQAGKDGADGFAHDVDSMKLQAADHGTHVEGILTFSFNGAPVRAILTETQISELAAAFTAASHWAESPRGRPQPDR